MAVDPVLLVRLAVRRVSLEMQLAVEASGFVHVASFAVSLNTRFVEPDPGFASEHVFEHPNVSVAVVVLVVHQFVAIVVERHV